MKEYPWGKGTPKWMYDATANDSDKSFTVPTGKIWAMISGRASLTTTATVGNRTPQIRITDGTNTVAIVSAPNLAASTTGNYPISFAGATDDFARSSETMLASFDPLILPAGYVIRVYDSSAVDVAADDLTVVLHYVEYDA